MDKQLQLLHGYNINLVTDVKVNSSGQLVVTKGGADTVLPFSGGNGTLSIKFSFAMKMSSTTNGTGTGTGTITVVIKNGKVQSRTITGSGTAYTIGGVPDAGSCTAGTFQITSITWTPN